MTGDVLAISSAATRGLTELHAHDMSHRGTDIFLTGDRNVAEDSGEAPGIEIVHPWTAPEHWSERRASPGSDMYGPGHLPGRDAPRWIEL